MQVQWQKLLLKTVTWLAAEIILGLLGLDNMADYSEFLQKPASISLNPVTISQTMVNS